MTGLFLYFRLEDKGDIQPIISDGEIVGVEGSTPSLGAFRILLQQRDVVVKTTFLSTILPKISQLKEAILSGIVRNPGAGLQLVGHTTQTPNLIVVEMAVESGFTLDMVYEPTQTDSVKY